MDIDVEAMLDAPYQEKRVINTFFLNAFFLYTYLYRVY